MIPSLPSTSTAPRPEGCWCEGAGGTGGRYLPVPDAEPVLLFDDVCSCPEGEAHEAFKALHHAEARERGQRERHGRVWQAMGIPGRFESYTLDSSPLAKSMPKIVEALRGGATGSWFFWGGYGTGKTGLAIGYAREWLHHEWGAEDVSRMIFRTVPRLLTEIRSTYNSGSDGPTEIDLLDGYAACSLLVLDDLGAEQVKNTGWVEDRLYQIIGERHDNMKPIVFTSNLSPKELADRLGERLTWRIIEMVGRDHIVHVDGPNLRDV